MSEELITVLAGGVLAVIGSFAGNYAISLKKSHEDAIKDAEREQSQKDQLRAILDEQKKVRKRLDSHNGYAEKFIVPLYLAFDVPNLPNKFEFNVFVNAAGDDSYDFSGERIFGKKNYNSINENVLIMDY